MDLCMGGQARAGKRDNRLLGSVTHSLIPRLEWTGNVLHAVCL